MLPVKIQNAIFALLKSNLPQPAMRLTGDIRKITTKRDSKNQDIEILIDRVEYLTHKKDGNYFQTFDYEVALETPLVITGDRLALKNAKPSADGEYEYNVYELVGEEYVLNADKILDLTLAYYPEEDLTILSTGYYAETLPPKEFELLKKEHEKKNSFKNRKARKR